MNHITCGDKVLVALYIVITLLVKENTKHVIKC